MGDAGRDVVDAAAHAVAVAQDLPCLHAGEAVLDTGAELFVERVVCLAPLKESLSLHALQSARLPGSGLLTTTTRRLSPSMTIW